MRPETWQLLKNIGFGILLIGTIGSLLWGSWHVVRLSALTISTVTVSGGETINHADIQADVEATFDGDWWGFVPRRFVWTYPQDEILDVVTATPRVKDPVVTRDGQTINITLAEFEPVALWCEGGRATTSPCVFLDNNGYGFAAAPQLTGGAFVRYSRVGETATTSQVFTDAGDFAQLRALVAQLAEFGWPVAAVELDQARDAFVTLVGGSVLNVTLTLSPTETVDNLQSVLTAEEYQHLKPDNFEYIDLRFGNKVFVNEFGVPEEDLGQATSSLAVSTTTVETTTEIE